MTIHFNWSVHHIISVVLLFTTYLLLIYSRVWNDVKSFMKKVMGDCFNNILAVDQKVETLNAFVKENDAWSKSKLNRLEKIIRNGKFDIRPIPASISKNTEEIVLAVANFLKVSISTSDILESFWLKSSVHMNESQSVFNDTVLVLLSPCNKQIIMKE